VLGAPRQCSQTWSPVPGPVFSPPAGAVAPPRPVFHHRTSAQRQPFPIWTAPATWPFVLRALRAAGVQPHRAQEPAPLRLVAREHDALPGRLAVEPAPGAGAGPLRRLPRLRAELVPRVQPAAALRCCAPAVPPPSRRLHRSAPRLLWLFGGLAPPLAGLRGVAVASQKPRLGFIRDVGRPLIPCRTVFCGASAVDRGTWQGRLGYVLTPNWERSDLTDL